MQSVRLGPDSIGRRQEFNLEETALGPHDDQAGFAAVDAARSPRVPRYGIKASAWKLYLLCRLPVYPGAPSPYTNRLERNHLGAANRAASHQRTAPSVRGNATVSRLDLTLYYQYNTSLVRTRPLMRFGLPCRLHMPYSRAHRSSCQVRLVRRTGNMPADSSEVSRSGHPDSTGFSSQLGLTFSATRGC